MTQKEVAAMSDAEWAKQYADLVWIRQKEAENQGGG